MPFNFSIDQTQTLTSIYKYSANVTSYDANTKIVTLDAPIDVSLGKNEVVGDVTSQYTITGNIVNVAQSISLGNSLPQLSTDEGGNFVGIFNVPPNTFRTGSKVFRVDNRAVDSDPNSATTFAEATFTSSGLSATAQRLNFAPSIDASSSTFTQVNQKDNQLIATVKTVSIQRWDPLAQTFIFDKENYPNGLFIKSIKLFFYSKPKENIPVKLTIVGTLNGYPNGKVLDYSTVVVENDKIVTASSPHYLDSSTYTEFVFPAPVYLQPGELYAFIVQSNSPEHKIYYAQQNSLAVQSTAKALPSDANPANPTKIGAAPYVGALFESQNSITWTADQSKDLMFVIDRCVFNTSVTPQISFVVPKGLPFRKNGTEDIQHFLDANNVSNLYGNYALDDMPIDAINLTTTDFTPTGTGIQYQYSATLGNGNLPVGPYTTSPGKMGSPTPENIYMNDGQGERVLLKSSNNSFTMTATLSSDDSDVSPIISDDGVSLYNIRYLINNMGIQNNVISLVSGGSGYTQANTTATVSDPDVGTDKAVLGVTVSGGVITDVYTVYSGSGYLKTPTITITDTSGSPGTGASALIYGETSAKGGNSYAKYFTKKVVLTPQNESGDLRVYYTAYKPFGSEIYIYYKILNKNDTQQFENTGWQLMTQIGGNNVYSATRSDLIEFEWAPGTDNVADNFISYTGSNGQVFDSFNQFAIKVVMSTNDNTQVPFLTDIRALALPSGTGI